MCVSLKKLINIGKQKNIFKTSWKSGLPSFSFRAGPVYESIEIRFSKYSKPEPKPKCNVQFTARSDVYGAKFETYG